MTETLRPRSREVTAGIERAGARAMLRAVGFTDEDFDRPQIGVAAMALSSLSVVTNANRLRTFRPLALPGPASPSGAEPMHVEVGTSTDRKEEEMATVRDPVCGMDIDPASAAGREEYEGTTYYFCSQGCHERFRTEPKKYAEAAR